MLDAVDEKWKTENKEMREENLHCIENVESLTVERRTRCCEFSNPSLASKATSN